MTTVITTATTKAEEDKNKCDSIGLTITVSTDQHNHDESVSKGSFMPRSTPSPIPFEADEDYSDGETSGKKNVSEGRSTSGSTGISSIMRQKSLQEHHQSLESSQIIPDNHAHVTALEDRVRDLEEKLSTLSMLLTHQNTPSSSNLRKSISSPKSSNNLRKFIASSGSSSPDSSVGEDSSSSPPNTPYRSLASFATIPSSNVPVLESPTPVNRRYRPHRNNSFSKLRDEGDDDFDSSYHQRSPRHSGSPRYINRRMSYRILHAPDSELDLRSCDDGNSSRSDSESRSSRINRHHVRNSVNSDTEKNYSTDDSFEKACRGPTLDSLPGSSRTSPILSNDPNLNRVLSPDSLNNLKDMDKSSSKPEILQSTLSNGKKGETTTSSSTTGGKHASSPANDNNISSSNSNKVNESATSETASTAPKHQKKKSNIKSKWLEYLNSVQDTNYDTDKQMEEFVKVPSAVEALLSFGFWISVDSFLYTLTMLPLRFLYSTCLLTIWFYKKLVGRQGSGSFTFHRHNSYHLIQVSIIYLIYAYVLMPINVSVLYHWIRSQSMVKLYLLVAIVEVFDRLMCSLGQDCLDSLYWNTTRRPRSSRLLVSALVVLVYTALHSFLLFVHVATLNVAMNSDDQALLSLLIGGNFAEIKSTVFKKYNKATLFKITASDICERFKLALFLLLVLTLNASQGMDKKMLYNYLSMCGIVWCAEWLSDWLKHSFITKFNYIASGVYSEYSLLLAGDVSGFGHEGENLDKSHAVVKRLGLAQIPLVCVMTKYLKEAYKYQTYENQPQTWVLVVGAFSIWFILFIIKLVLAFFLNRMCRNKLEAAPEFSKNNTTVAKKKN